ncbi:MAG TPA: dienelactone hydrolase family protein [Ktedonobacteraceae bacterium]|nr:dienelactone hydrolase family protein [Ktedonobacteraceae bacterium]
MKTAYAEKIVGIPTNAALLEGSLVVPDHAQGLVVFAHGSGSSRFSPRNNFVASILQRADIATLLVDLLTREEDENYETRFDIDFLTERLLLVTRWLQNQPLTHKLAFGYFGASTGAAAALRAAADDATIRAVVSRGGRPDMAAEALARVQSPTLLIVGGNDSLVLKLNRKALAALKGTKQLVIIPGATHLFEERGALEEVAHLATQWFKRYLS